MSQKHDVVVRFDLGFQTEAAVSGPLLLQTEYDAFLTFNAVRINASGKYDTAGIGIIEFKGCSSTKFGYPNDEALGGHPLYKRGLKAYGVFEVLGSSWIRQMTEQNRICFPHTVDSKERHFIFTFHDSTFECIADSYVATLSIEPYQQIFKKIAERVLNEGS